MSNFKDKMIYPDSNYQSSEELLKVFQKLRNGKKCCIVEGESDVLFYKNLSNYDVFNSLDYIYAYPRQKDEDGERKIGKESVIETYLKICDTEYKKEIKNMIFIIDHDYYGFPTYPKLYSKKELNEMKRCITITNLYSFENYFMNDTNLKNVFKLVSLNEKDLKMFEDHLKIFINEIKEFNIYKSTTVNVCKIREHQCYIGASNLYSNNDIFKYDFKKLPVYDKDKLEKQLKKMKECVYKEPKAKKCCKIEAEKFNGKYEYARDYSRGHDLFNFLFEYLKQIHNININPKTNKELYVKIIKILKTDMIFKYANGKMINPIV